MAKKEPKHMLIVGGGVSAVAVLQQLYQRVIANEDMLPLNVEVVEAGDTFAGGLAWDKKNLLPCHSVNSYSDDELLAIRRTWEKDIPNLEELKKHKADYPYELSRLGESANFKAQFDYFVDKLRQLGVNVRLTPNTRVENITREDKHSLFVEMSTGRDTIVNYVVLATGHWQQQDTSLGDHKGVFASPWPASKLQEGVDCTKPVAVMGSSLSAVDGIMTLADKAGEFHRDEHGKVTFKRHPGNEDFKVTAFSPHGILPTVLGRSYISGIGLPPPRVFRDEGGHVSLDQMFTMLSNDFISKHVNDRGSADIIRVLGGPESPEEKIETLYKAMRAMPAKDLLRDQLAQAKETFITGKPMAWQKYLRDMDTYIEKASNFFSAEDHERYVRHVRPLYAKLAYGMVISNAEQMLALMEAGALEVKALGEQHSIGTKQEGGTKLPGAEIRYTDAEGKAHEEYFPNVVKASGDNPMKLRESSTLMKNMFKSGLVMPTSYKYRDDENGRRAVEQEQADPSLPKVSRKGSNGYYRDVGGIELDLNTFKPYQRPDHRGGAVDNLFVIGPPTIAQYSLVQGSTPIGMASHNIVEQIEDDIMKNRDVVEAPQAAQRRHDTQIVIDPDTHEAQILWTGAVRPPEDKIATIRAMFAKKLGVTEDQVQFFTPKDAPEGLQKLLRQQQQGLQ